MMSLKKIFKAKLAPLALSALFGLSSLACAGMQRVSPTRYGSDDPVCGIDPACRRLTAGEIEVLRSVFGNDLRYDAVRIYNYPYSELLGAGGPAMTPDGNIYLPNKFYVRDDFSQTRALWPFLSHESTHVWQQQGGVNIRLEALILLIKHRFNYAAAYEYKLDDVMDFGRLNIEQQGQFIEDYVRSRNLVAFLDGMARSADSSALRNDFLGRAALECKLQARREALLRPYLPVEPDRVCNGKGDRGIPKRKNPSEGITFVK